MLMTIDEIFEEFEELDPRDQSQYLLELGYDLPRFEKSQQRDCDLVAGCQSQVWLTAGPESTEELSDGADPEIVIRADSDAEIVRGLISILIASYSGMTASQIVQHDIDAVFERLRLRKYISPQRHNGLQGMVNRIREIAGLYSPDSGAPNVNVVDTLPTREALPEVDQQRVKFDPLTIRRQFPVLNQILDDGQRPVFLDSAASAQKPQVVIDKEREVEEQYFANAYRGRYRFGARVDEELEESRKKIADFIGAASPTEIAFTAGTTASINMIAFGWGRRHVSSEDEILINEMEHHANFVPWQQLAKQTGATLRFIPLTEDGQLDLQRLNEVLTEKTRVVAVSGMSNVLGTVNPIRELTKAAHAVGAVIVVDAAQSVPHMPTHVANDDIDFLTFSGHKIYGPTGVGVLYGRMDRLLETDPILFGGHMISSVTRTESSWAAPPSRFEAGTLPIVQAIAMGTAIDWVQETGLEAIHAHEQHLLQAATRELSQIPAMRIFGPDMEHKGAIVSFRMSDVHPEDLAAMLDRRAVFTRHGHHCTMPLHDLLGVSATTRASFAGYNTMDDVTALVDAIHFARRTLRLE